MNSKLTCPLQLVTLPHRHAAVPPTGRGVGPAHVHALCAGRQLAQKSLPNPDGWESQFSPKMGALGFPFPQSDTLNLVKFPDTSIAGALSHSSPEIESIMKGVFIHDL